MMKKSQKGNVLFIILIGVVLFAALTAAVTRSNQGTTSMDRERGTISASDLMAYAGSLEKTVARILGDEVSEGHLSFANPVWQYNNGNPVETAAMFPNCTVPKCGVFNPAGGGLEAKTFTGAPIASPVAGEIKAGHAGVYSLKITGVGTTAHDLVLVYAGIDQNTCKQINSQLGITNPNGFPPQDTWAGAVLYAGSFTGPNNATDEIGDSATQLVGKTAGCVTRAGGTHGQHDNYFYQVLLPR